MSNIDKLYREALQNQRRRAVNIQEGDPIYHPTKGEGMVHTYDPEGMTNITWKETRGDEPGEEWIPTQQLHQELGR